MRMLVPSLPCQLWDPGGREPKWQRAVQWCGWASRGQDMEGSHRVQWASKKAE